MYYYYFTYKDANLSNNVGYQVTGSMCAYSHRKMSPVSCILHLHNSGIFGEILLFQEISLQDFLLYNHIFAPKEKKEENNVRHLSIVKDK